MIINPRQQKSMTDYVKTANAIYQGYQQSKQLGQVARKSYDWIKGRRIRPRTYKPSRFQRKLEGPRRKLQPVKTKSVALQTNEKYPSGGYTQWETLKGKSRLSKKLSLIAQMNRIMKLNQEKLIFRWNGVKNFDDNGFYWLRNRLIADRRYMPCYAFDLTSCINQRDGTQVLSAPLSQMYLIGGQVGFDATSHVGPDGTTITPNLYVEQGSYATAGADISPILPHNKDILKWLAINMNCWGAKAKSTKFTIQIVRFKDEKLVPTHLTAASEQRTALFQNIIKPYAYNPISTTATQLKKYYKVLKTETFMIQPTSTTESDADPHVKTVKWFVRLNRLLDYVQRHNNLATNADVVDQADFSVNVGGQNDCYVKPEQRLYLMIYASNFAIDAEDTNAETPSFDLSVRMCHQTVA